MLKYLLIIFPMTVNAGLYLDTGLGVPLSPNSGYTPDMYGILGFGYTHHVDDVLSLDVGFAHRSLTGIDNCHQDNCNGDNAIETKLRLEWK